MILGQTWTQTSFDPRIFSSTINGWTCEIRAYCSKDRRARMWVGFVDGANVTAPMGDKYKAQEAVESAARTKLAIATGSLVACN